MNDPSLPEYSERRITAEFSHRKFLSLAFAFYFSPSLSAAILLDNRVFPFLQSA